MHIRILNQADTQIIESKVAMDEINHAMMGGKRDVQEMSHSRQSASILYTDGRHVVLRPATDEEIEQAQHSEPERCMPVNGGKVHEIGQCSDASEDVFPLC